MTSSVYPTAYTRQSLIELSNEMRQSDDPIKLLQQRGLDKAAFIKALKEQELPYPRAATPTQQLILAEYPKLIDSGLAFIEIAAQLGIPEPTLRYNVHSLGLSLPLSTTYQKALRVRDYLKRCGGTITQAIRALQLATSARYIRAHFEETDFNADDYRFAYQRHGDWIVQVGTPERKGHSDWIVPAKCTRCEKVFNVSLSNIRNGNSHCCHICASKTRQQRTILCTTDGTIYRSLNQMVSSLSEDDLGYQTIRKTLLRTGQFTSSDGRSFRFYHGDAKPNYAPDTSAPVQQTPAPKPLTEGRPVQGVSKLRELALLGDY